MKLLLLTFLIAFSFSLKAQQTVPRDSTARDSVINKKTTFTFLGGAIFAPVLHYYGRTDSLKSNALLPTVYLQFDSLHFYVSATSVFLSDKTQTLTYAGTITEAGYKFGQKIKGFGGSIYANKFFYNTTQLPQSAFQEQAGLNLYYLDKFINFTASGDVAFSKENPDAFASVGINHIFKKSKGKNIYLATPTFIANAGTQNFTNILSGTYQNASRFTMLDYELSVPLMYVRNKHLFIMVTPTYVLPVNIVTVPGHPEISETAGNIFFANFTVLYQFKG